MALPLGQPGVGERQAAQPVVDMRVDAGIVEDEVGPDPVEERSAAAGRARPDSRRRRCRRSSATSRSLCCLRAGKLARQWTDSVNTRGSSARMAAVPSPWCTSRSIDQRRARQPLGEQHAGGDRDVVEHAEPDTEAGEGMMAAAGGVAGDAVLQRQAGGQDGAGDGAAAAQGQDRRQRQAEPTDRRRIEPLLEDAGHIAAVVGELEPGLAAPAPARIPAPHGAARSRRRWASSRANLGIGNRCDAGSGVT